MHGNIVVVEDEPDVREFLREALSSQGFHIIGLDEAYEAKIRNSPERPDMFLIDIMLTGMSGVELAENLRSSGFADTPMVAMSASRVMLRVASESGLFQGTMPKPFDLLSMMSCVEQYAR